MSSGPPSNQPPPLGVLLPSSATRGYRAVAHRAGNNLADLERAIAAGADAIECDFWHDGGRLSLRHERKLPALPLLFDRWYVRFSRGDLWLRDLLPRLSGRAELFLDIKSSTTQAADAILKLYRGGETSLPSTVASSRHWDLLDRLGREDTALRMLYSVGRTDQIAPLLRRAEATCPPAGTSIRQAFLDAETVGRLHDVGLLVYAWIVNDLHRAAQLRSWGVDGIISDDVALFAALDRG